MIWVLTIPVALVAAYAVLCLLIGADMRSDGSAPYWILLLASAAILYVAWFHPISITFT